MVLSNDLDVLAPEAPTTLVASTSNQSKDQDDRAKALAMTQLPSPAPMAVVRADITAYEDDSVRRLLLRYSGADVLPAGWINGPQKDGVQVVYGEVAGSDWYTMKTTGKMAVSAEKALRALMPCEMTPKFDDMTKEVRLVERLSDATEVRLVLCKSVMFTSPRGLCVTTTMRRLSDGRIVIVTRSVDHPAQDQLKGYTKANSYVSGYVITPDAENPKACEVSVLAHMDLGGSLPPMVLRFVGLSAPIKMVRKVQEIVQTIA